MAIPLTINGAVFEYPENFDENWGVNATGWAQAVTNGMLQMAGGSFPITADINFGSNFGVLSKYFQTRSSNPATAGTIRLSSADAGIVFRNNANTGNLVLTTDSSNNLLFNGIPIGTSGTLTNSHIYVGNVSNVPTDVVMSGDVNISNTGVTTVQPGAITNAKITGPISIANGGTNSTTVLNNNRVIVSSAGAITETAAITGNRTLVSDTNGVPTASTTTSTELGYVSGVTSAIQTQLNAITANFPSGVMMVTAASSAPTGWLICNGSAVSRTTFSSLFSAIGTTYGVGDGSTTFNIPNMINNVAVGQGGSIAGSLGATSGAVSVTPTSIAHTHTISHQHSTINCITNGASTGLMRNDNPYGTDSVSTTYSDFGTSAKSATSQPYSRTSDSLTANSGSTTVTMNASSVVQPSLGINWIIKT
jgi:microcystin-dependent protein